MATTITAGATTITPDLVLDYEARSETSNTIHEVLNSDARAITLGVESLRAGTLNLYFATQTAAWAAHTFLKTSTLFTLASTDATVIGMRFVREGRMSIEIDTRTMTRWLLHVNYQEVPA